LQHFGLLVTRVAGADVENRLGRGVSTGVGATFCHIARLNGRRGAWRPDTIIFWFRQQREGAANVASPSTTPPLHAAAKESGWTHVLLSRFSCSVALCHKVRHQHAKNIYAKGGRAWHACSIVSWTPASEIMFFVCRSIQWDCRAATAQRPPTRKKGRAWHAGQFCGQQREGAANFASPSTTPPLHVAAKKIRSKWRCDAAERIQSCARVATGTLKSRSKLRCLRKGLKVALFAHPNLRKQQ
jgi:hypothetical protein